MCHRDQSIQFSGFVPCGMYVRSTKSFHYKFKHIHVQICLFMVNLRPKSLTDRLCKILPFLRKLGERFEEVIPSEEVCTDETIVAFEESYYSANMNLKG